MKCSCCNAFPNHQDLLTMLMERSEDQTKFRPNFVENFRGGRALGHYEKKLLSADRMCFSIHRQPRIKLLVL